MTSPGSSKQIHAHAVGLRAICPNCNEPMQRVDRKGWMRFLPGSRLFRCFYCYKNHFYFAGRLF